MSILYDAAAAAAGICSYTHPDRVNYTEVPQFGHWKQIGTKIGNFYMSVPTLGRDVAKKAKTDVYTY